MTYLSSLKYSKRSWKQRKSAFSKSSKISTQNVISSLKASVTVVWIHATLRQHIHEYDCSCLHPSVSTEAVISRKQFSSCRAIHVLKKSELLLVVPISPVIWKGIHCIHKHNSSTSVRLPQFRPLLKYLYLNTSLKISPVMVCKFLNVYLKWQSSVFWRRQNICVRERM